MTWSTDAAVELATELHDATGVRDPGSGEPYISHPLRVMRAVRAAGYNERYQRVAILHDTIEDTGLTAEALAESGAPPDEIEAVLAVTKSDATTDYVARIEKAAANEIGGVVKGFDMLDNSDPARVEALARVEPDRAAKLARKYAAGLARLDELRPGWRAAPTL